MTGGLAIALVATLAFGVASVLQQIGAGRVTDTSRSGLLLLPVLLRQPLFAIGAGLDVVGFVLTGVAARQLPLVVLEGVLALAVAVTAGVAAVVARERLSRAALLCLPTMVVGLVLLGAASPGEVPGRVEVAAPLLLVPTAVLAVGVVAIDRARPGPTAGLWLAAVAGLAFGGWAVAARFGHPGVLLVVVGVAINAIGLSAFGAALRRVTATTAMAITVSVETLVPTALGLSAGDHLRPGTEAPSPCSGVCSRWPRRSSSRPARASPRLARSWSRFPNCSGSTVALVGGSVRPRARPVPCLSIP